MKKLMVFSVLAGLAGCAQPQPSGPATPVFFQPYSAALDAPARAAVADAAKRANAEPLVTVTVFGAADSVGSAKANHYLSAARAQVVADTLEADGVAAYRIETRADGIVFAPAPAGTPAQFARRVLIQIND
jgi:outer membrane protein OmpA-like peptidoglycan-associated protein